MKIFNLKNIWLVLLLVGLNHVAKSQENYTPTKENLEARKWFQDSKFGLFIHWGVYSTLANGEWVMEHQRIRVRDYEKLPALFNPTEFDAKQWVALAKAAGMKYITITSKHHDGFAMYDSKVSDYNIVQRTPYKKDPIKMLADECKKEGIKLFIYYSHLDWHHPDYYPLGENGQGYTGRPSGGDWNKYLDYMNAQLKELLTGYGEIGGIWFDGWWDKKDADWKLDRQYKLIHSLQPQTLIGNNHHQAPKPGEDFQMFEKDLPGHNTTGFSGESKIGQLPLETCETMNGSWGYNFRDNKFKSTRALIHYLVKAAGHNSNFLLNVGPMPNGKIQPEFEKTLKEMGTWMQKYGETIYGTRGGPIGAHGWGVTTQKGNKIYVHILDQEDASLWLPKQASKIKAARLFKDKSKIQFTENENGIILKLPKADPADFDLVLELEI